jgi:hypothetical protein
VVAAPAPGPDRRGASAATSARCSTGSSPTSSGST